MKNFLSVRDVKDVQKLVKKALKIKRKPFGHEDLGRHKTLGLIFMNPSTRTRLSTQRAAQNLGMDVMIMNLDKEGWALETQEGIIMNQNTVEHIKDAAAVMGKYCDVIGIRSFPKLIDKQEDYSEDFFMKFIKYAKVPIVSLESATLHPLQSFADLITIDEHKKKERPKVVLTWAPHIKPLPQAVANSFAEWMVRGEVEFVVTHPKGYELDKKFTDGAAIVYDQEKALTNADFIYVKNWSSYTDYGKVLTLDGSWMLTKEKLKVTNDAKVMHCLPVRRNIELSDEVLDSKNSLVIEQAENRIYSCQTVLKEILETTVLK